LIALIDNNRPPDDLRESVQAENLNIAVRKLEDCIAFYRSIIAGEVTEAQFCREALDIAQG